MRRHQLDLFSLIAGVLVLGTAVVLLFPGLRPETLGRLTPVAFIALGLGILASARPSRDTASVEGPDTWSADDVGDSPAAPGPSVQGSGVPEPAAAAHHDETARLDIPADGATERLDDDVRRH